MANSARTGLSHGIFRWLLKLYILPLLRRSAKPGVMTATTSARNLNMDGKDIKITLPTILSFNGGYVDTAGYLALQGLFTAHALGSLGASGPHWMRSSLFKFYSSSSALCLRLDSVRFTTRTAGEPS
jgi:hypothetical protein